MPLRYFDTISPTDWSVKDIFEAIQKQHPEKKRAYHGIATKKELEELKNHAKQSYRESAEKLLKQFKLPPPQDSTMNQQSISSSVQSAASIINNVNSINQVVQQTINQEGVERSRIPAKRSLSELEGVSNSPFDHTITAVANTQSSSADKDDDFDDLLFSVADQGERDDDSIDKLFNPNNDDVNEVDFDTLPTTVYPRLNQAVATKFQTDSKYTVGDTEYQSLFAEYKKKCLNDLSKLNTIYLEPNFYKLIALENILFLKPGSYSTDMLRLFTEENLNKLYKHLLKTHCSFDKGKHTDLLNLIDGIFEEACFDYHQMDANLDQLSHSTEDTWSKRIIRCVRELLEFLPRYKETDTLNECDLKTRFLDPVTKYFFNDIDGKFRLRYPETNPNERKLFKKETLRPDCLITNIPQSQYKENIGYGEVKSAYYTNRTRALILDMYRLVYFSKATIDTHQINGPVMLQVVGLKVSVYTLVLISAKFYVSLFLFDFTLPQCKSEIIDFLPSVKKLAVINEALANCSSGNNKVDSDMICPSHDTPLFERRVETKVDKEDSDSIHLC